MADLNVCKYGWWKFEEGKFWLYFFGKRVLAKPKTPQAKAKLIADLIGGSPSMELKEADFELSPM